MIKKKSNQTEEVVPVEQTDNSQLQIITDTPDKKRSITYVVVREGFRVSDREYEDSADPAAVIEKEFWEKVAKNHSYGEPVEIVQYDAKKHRVW